MIQRQHKFQKGLEESHSSACSHHFIAFSHDNKKQTQSVNKSQNDKKRSFVKPSLQVPQWRQRLPLSLWIHRRGHQIWVVIIVYTIFRHWGKYLQKWWQYFKVRERSVFLLSLWLSRPAEVPKMVLHHCSKVLICVFSCTIIFLILTVYALVWHSWS